MLGITGATAAGKSRVASRVAALLGGELVSVDSVKVYRGLDIGANKGALLRHAAACGVRVHMVDVREPEEQMTMGEYVSLAGATIADILARGKLPVLVGGTAFYMGALVGAHASSASFLSS